MGGIGLLADAGALCQEVAMRRDERRYPPPGRFVDVAGRRLHTIALGNGSPTVVLESGLSGSCLDWSRVQPAVAAFASVVAYDRAGCGWSDPGPRPRTSAHIAGDLHTLLHNAGLAGPYVLVGHSAGGLHARVFAQRYHDEVAGLVLVDAAPEGQRERWPRRPLLARAGNELQWRAMQLYPLWARLGLMRLRGRPNGVIDALPQELQPLATALGLRSRAYDWTITEAVAIAESERQVRCCNSLRAVPLAVVSAHLRSAPWGLATEQADRLWQQMQDELAGLSANSTRTIVPESGHFIHLDQPDAVVTAIRWVVEMARRTGPGCKDAHRVADF